MALVIMALDKEFLPESLKGSFIWPDIPYDNEAYLRPLSASPPPLPSSTQLLPIDAEAIIA